MTAIELLPGKLTAQEIRNDKTNVTIEKITGNIDEYVGQTVTVRSGVERELDESGFVLQANEFFGGEPFLVFNADAVPVTRPSDDIPVQATGTVREFVIADIEREYGIDLDDELYVDYENRPAIVADSVALAPTIEDLAENPDAFYNQTIAVEGEVGELFSSNTMSLYEDGWIDDIGLMVVGVNNRDLNAEGSALQEGETIVVTGMAQPLDTNMLQQDAELGWDSNTISEFESRYTDRPVIVADDVYPSALDE
ncbi:hypothetical protein [Myxosarcina sp. GI1]|uniref:hypothetical protein n=1 Tax=Myxosarcina sp. GI1 TaxID=1541065 RepID=UPI000689A1AB|nr:hypothetical protein [Myxosarcina sp. GI1]